MKEAGWDREVDVLVVGTGNGALTSALCNWEMGTRDILVIEKTDKVGGTSATSGGGIWIPDNHYAKACGAEDSPEDAKKYLMGTLFGEDVPEEMIDTYIEQAPKMLRFLADRTDVVYESLEHYPDYYTNYEGARAGHRSLEPRPIDMSELGDDWKNLRWTHHMMRMFNRIHFTQVEAHTIMTQAPGWKSLLAKMLLGYVTDIGWRFRTPVDRRLCTGSAGVARLYLSLKKRAIPLEFQSRLVSLVEQDGRVTGAVVDQGGSSTRILARKAVVLGAGGFEKNQSLREQYLPQPTNTEWSAGNPANEGDALLAGLSLGAKTRLMKDAWWTTTLCVPDEPTPRLAIMEKSFPGSCVVNRAGQRFANESQNYMAFQKDLFASHSDDNPNAPAWQIFDARFRRNFMVGPLMTAAMKPDWQIPKSWFDTGFVAKAGSIRELAETMGIDSDGLAKTIAKMNHYAVTGIDEDFHRGESAYDRYYADPTIKPNPCLAAIDEAPFYAMRIEAGDFGTLGGLDTDIHGRVKLAAGGIIEGLFAVGNCSAAILPTYPGPGATLGPAMTMAYQSAKLINGIEG